MPYPYSFPTLLDEVRTFSISDLKGWGYLKPDTTKAGTIRWSRNGNETASIHIFSAMIDEPCFIELSYRCNDEPVKYKVYLTSVPSNLGVGKIWYFRCPHTGKRCRKLYGAGKYFLHREAYPDAMYEKQTYSKQTRVMISQMETLFEIGELNDELNSKYFTPYYNGKPTKRYQQILLRLKQLQMRANTNKHLY